MKNFIFILFAIILFGFKQYQKSLKKKNESLAKQPPKSNSNPTGFNLGNIDQGINDFVNTFFGKNQEEVLLDSVSDDEYHEISSNYNTYEEDVKEVDNEEFEPYSIENDDSIDLKKRHNKQFGINQNKEDINTETLDFDLKTALIYDAILNPPYIIN